MTTAILYQNDAKDITLFDIPTSISIAQASPLQNGRLISTEPSLCPYPSNEPKTARARARLQQDNEAKEALHSALRSHIAGAIEEIRERHNGSWCLPRCVGSHHEHTTVTSQKRKEKTAEAAQDSVPPEPDFHTFAANLDAFSCFHPIKEVIYLSSNHDEENNFPDLSSIYNNVVCNANDKCTNLSIGQKEKFIIPPFSKFILSNMTTSLETLKAASIDLLPPRMSSTEPGQFDLMIIDPPWPNLSAKRAGHYKTDQENNLIRQLIKSGLQDHLSQGGYLGVWITNKTASRKAVENLFNQWNVRQVEEWVWVKTTINGETVTDLDGLWRKPYEIFCLGKKNGKCFEGQPHTTRADVKIRIIAAVPDLHSRKPCLKELIEPYMPSSSDYQALEIFARNLTAGWWSMGDEVLKFNWEGYWTMSLDPPESSF